MHPSLSQRLADYILYSKEQERMAKGPSTVITLSRSYGCPSRKIAEALSLSLEHLHKKSWKWVNREIIERAARELHLKPQEVDELAQGRSKNFFQSVMESFSPEYHPTEDKVRRTVSQMLLDLADKGRVIIIGSAGASILYDHPHALHVRLDAPQEWRVDNLMQSEDSDRTATLDKVRKKDHQREGYRMSFWASDHFKRERYDLSLDCSRFDVDQCTLVILEALRVKGELEYRAPQGERTTATSPAPSMAMH